MTQRRWLVHPDLLPSSIEAMRPLGARGREGLALWFGTLDDEGVAKVTHVVQPVGPGFESTPLYLRLSMRAIGQLTDWADNLGVFLIGQIHSHPGNFVELSELDIRQGFRFQDFLSVVCPHYAQRSETKLSDCGIHTFDNGAYRRIARTEIGARLATTPGSTTALRMEVRDD